ncbi:CRISPR-associated protein Cas4 [Spiractinospora alimapuensis]|uniref:CRISPR-associated protein Cas4 n=1 Tax=Spiractinospora alimapuensis TaxID=2820884 RepID=UPI001F36B718|nr:CRISPR-associated protein Cas4 [Spiractinospora alimapuensis]QVQ53393.1 CRISPR-associated protein Cas4 [Spiractinospora alimapuensis]
MANNEPLTPVTLSSLEHYAYCPRQSGLILLEDGYTDDAATTRGTLMHRKVHEPGTETRGTTRTLRALPVWSDRHGLQGVCDVVEVHNDGRIVPVEHKSGTHHPGGPSDLQVAGQAMCLEEMWKTRIDTALIYAGADRRRHTVAVDQALRDRVLTTAQAVRAMLHDLHLPHPAADQRCRRCSMNTMCMPKLLAGQRSYTQAVARLHEPYPEADLP